MLFLASCAGGPEATVLRSPLQGVVYNEAGRPVSGGVVEIDGESASVTNERGRFAVPPVSPGTHLFGVKHPDYLYETFDLVIRERTDVVILHVASIEDELESAKEALAGGRLEEAERRLRHTISGDLMNHQVRYLLAVVAWRRGNTEDAAELLRAFPQGQYPAVERFLRLLGGS
jgi:hypothetical protein